MSGRRVGANLLWVVPGQVGGSEDYTVRLLRAMADAGADVGGDDSEADAPTLFVNRSFTVAHPHLIEEYPTVVAPTSGRGRGRRVALEATWLARRTRGERMDLVHHMGGTMPVVGSRPGMVTIHDLQPFAHPEHFRAPKRYYLERIVPRSVRDAVIVVALSEHTRADIVERIGVPAERILLVPPGIDPDPPPVTPSEVARVDRTYQLGGRPFFLYPAITWPHKNHTTLVRAFAALAAAEPEPLLVLTGGAAGAEARIRTEIDELGIGDRVRRLGRVPRRDVDSLLCSATALAFASAYEGFGIPVLEAMSRSCPVIASSITALPEVVGDGGLLVDPFDVDGWAAAMTLLLRDAPARAELVARGHRRAAHFSWDQAVHLQRAAYDAAFDRLGR